MSDTVITLLVVLVPLALIIFLAIKTEKRKASNPRAAHAARKIEQMKSQQKNIGNRIYNELQSTIERFNFHSQFGLRLNRIKENGGSYSIFVGIPDDSVDVGGGPSYTGHPVLDVSVNVAKDEITVGWGPYPNPEQGTFTWYGIQDEEVEGLISTIPLELRQYLQTRHSSRKPH